MHRPDSRSGIHPDELTIAELLKDNGYTTACIGKWHLGSMEPFLPRNQGFDYYFGMLHNLDPVSTYEGGLRVPAIAWGPGLGLRAGTASSAVVRAMDWYPTLATFASIKVPEGRVIDGRDVSPLLMGETTTWKRIQENPNSRAIRKSRRNSVAWQFCFRMKCAVVPDRRERFHPNLQPTVEP